MTSFQEGGGSRHDRAAAAPHSIRNPKIGNNSGFFRQALQSRIPVLILLVLSLAVPIPAMAVTAGSSVVADYDTCSALAESKTVSANTTLEEECEILISQWESAPAISSSKAATTVMRTKTLTSGVDDSYTKSLLHLNGADGSTVFTDETGKTWSASGNSNISTSQSKFGGASLATDGSGDFISTADSDDWNLGQNFTIDFWVRFNQVPPATILLGTNAMDSRYYKPGWLVSYQEAVGGLRFSGCQGSANWPIHLFTPWTPQAGTWYHVAITRDGTNTIRTFINGQQTGSLVSSYALPSGTQNLFIGGIDSLSASSLNGNIDEVRISKGIARWTSNFTPPNHEYGPVVTPVANFTATPRSGPSPLTVQFNDTSENWPTSWAWDFGDGDSTNASVENPLHTYASAGTYTVSHTATNSAGSNEMEKTGYVTVRPYFVYAEAAESGDVFQEAYGFWDALKGSNYDDSVTWVDSRGESNIIGYPDADASHWTSDASNWVDKGDFVYYSGHGFPNGFSFHNLTQHAYAANIHLGSGRTKWAVIDACESLNYTTWQNWNPSFNGLHILLGWNTSTVPSFDNHGIGRGKIFAELMEHKSEHNATQMNIIDAWEWAGRYTWGIDPTTSDFDVFNAAIYDTNCWDDYLPGWIPEGHSICTTLNGTHAYTSRLIFKKTNESRGSTTSMSFVDGMYSVEASAPVTENTVISYIPVKPGYTSEWVSSLAKSLGMSGNIRETEDAFYASDADAQQYYFEVRKDTSTIAFQKYNGRSGLPQPEASSVAAVDSFLRKNNLLPSDTPKAEVLNNFAESIAPSGEHHIDWKTNVVTYPQMIDGLPVFNAQFTVEVDSENRVIGLWRNWQDYEPYQEITVKSPEVAFTEFKGIHDSDKNIKSDKTKVTDVSLGYVMQPSADGKRSLEPVYVFEGDDQIGKANKSFEPVTIDAKKQVARTYTQRTK